MQQGADVPQQQTASAPVAAVQPASTRRPQTQRGTSDRTSRWNVSFWLSLLLICGVGVLLRYSSHAVISFNPDECDYVAAGTYFWHEGLSPFSGPPYYFPYVAAFHKIMAATFGPFCVPEIRWVITSICVIIACCIFFQMTAKTGCFLAFLTAILFVGMNPFCEGLSANREWPSILFVILSNGIILRQERIGDAMQRPTLCLLAGVVAGFGLFFKEQTLFLALGIPLYFVFKTIAHRRSLRPAAVAILAYAVGGVLAGVIYISPLLWHGTLAAHLADKHDFGSTYTKGYATTFAHWYTVQRNGFGSSPFWEFIAVAAGMSCVILGRGLWRRIFRASAPSILDSALARLYAIQFLLGLYVVQMGLRYFPHYFLFLLPSLVVLVGILTFIIERRLLLMTLQARLEKRMLGQLLFRLALIGLLMWPEPPMVSVAGTPRGPGQKAAAKLELAQISTPQDHIFVWAWLPEIYVMQRRFPATRFSGCATIVYDFGRAPDDTPVKLVDNRIRDLLAELQRTKPKLLIDARELSYALAGSNEIYNLKRYPAILDYVKQHYGPGYSVDGLKVYQRKKASE